MGSNLDWPDGAMPPEDDKPRRVLDVEARLERTELLLAINSVVTLVLYLMVAAYVWL